MANAIAAYAAIVATAAVIWQIYTWVRDREPDLRLDLARAFVVTEEGRPLELLVIEVWNLSSNRRANITSAGYGASACGPDGRRGGYRSAFERYEGSTLPGVVEPNDVGIACQPFPDTDLSPGFGDPRIEAWVWTATARRPVEKRMPPAEIGEFRDPARELPVARWRRATAP